MNNKQIGMFLEQHKDNLLPSHLSVAEKALPFVNDKEVKHLLAIKTKSPTVNTLFATFFGWCGADNFYLGYPASGFVRILLTLISIALYILTNFTFDFFAGDILVGKMFISAAIIQYGSLAIAGLFAIAYFISLMINIKKASTAAKIKNALLLKIRVSTNTSIIENYKIG